MGPYAKAKVSITVERELLGHVDDSVRATRFASRSAVIEAALARWWQAERRRARDAEIDAYYGARTPDDRDEDGEWAAVAGAAFTKTQATKASAPGAKRARKGRGRGK